jgi:ubiquitin-conjugating enzyme E2 variant
MACFCAGWLALALRCAAGRDAASLLALAAVSLPVGVLIADFASGVVHWLADEFFHEDTPVLGTLLIRPFREHHRDPLAITRHGWLEVSGNNALVCLPLLAWVWGGTAAAAPGPPWTAVVLTTTLAVVLTNQVHKWAHAERVPRIVAALQSRGILLSPQRHARHHERLDRAYCVTTGWLNAPLDAIRLFPRAARLAHRRRAT